MSKLAKRSTVPAMKLVAAAALVALVGSAGCDKSRGESKKLANEGIVALGRKQAETAIEKLDKATQAWGDNHSAWYYLGGAYMQRNDFEKASNAFQKAVDKAPDEAMYQMWYGITLYKKAVDNARKEQAARESKKPEEIDPDLSAVNFSKALEHLQEAVKLNPDLWRAHYFMGRIYRDTDDAKKAAEELSKTISFAPSDPAPWIALGELYLKWDYTDQALEIARQGVEVVPGGNDKSDVYFVEGMAYDGKRNDDKAIEAFTSAIEAKGDNHKAKFQRGQAYFRKGDFTKAKKDLEEFSKSGGASLEFPKQQAQKMLLDIAAKSATQANTPTEKPSPEDLVKKKGG